MHVALGVKFFICAKKMKRNKVKRKIHSRGFGKRG
jgi:hypothetical protein